ncbi:hypothetical protein D3C78_678020 [compost metagenome]
MQFIHELLHRVDFLLQCFGLFGGQYIEMRLASNVGDVNQLLVTFGLPLERNRRSAMRMHRWR